MRSKLFKGIRELDPPRGDLIAKPGVGARTVWPRWDVQSPETQNLFRLLPVIDPETGALLPYRNSGERRDFGPWIFAAHVATIGGPRGTSFITADTREYYGAEIQSAPYCMLYTKVRNAILYGAKPEWRSYNLVRLSPDDANMPLLAPPELKYMAMCFIACHHEYPLRDRLYGIDPNDPMFVVVMTRTAGVRLLDRLDDNPALDITALSGGAFVRVHQSNDPALRGYDVAVVNQYGKLTPVLPATVVGKLRWWDDVLHFPNSKEQIEIICNSGIPADVVRYAFKDTEYEEFIPSHVRDAEGGAPVPPPVVDAPSAAPTSDVAQVQTMAFTSTLDIPEEYKQALAQAESRRRKRD